MHGVHVSSLMGEIAGSFEAYGYRCMQAELRQRGWHPEGLLTRRGSDRQDDHLPRHRRCCGPPVERGTALRPCLGSRRVAPGTDDDVLIDGKRVPRTRLIPDAGPTVAEHWVIQGSGHAWSGGDYAGSCADATGSDASREMIRFFLETDQT